jgi:cobalt-precorrin 5A hydrolase/precorrin-3B C17-methyltransferase
MASASFVGGYWLRTWNATETIAQAITKVFLEYELAESAIAGIATIDIKADEVGLLELCQKRDLPLITFNKEVLSAVTVSQPFRQFVKSELEPPALQKPPLECF